MAAAPYGAKIAAYSSASAHGGVAAADPHKLIVMLMDGALERIATARGLMSNGTGGAERAQLLHRAVAILDELRNSLNFKAGELAHNLDALYEYMCTRLMQASASNKPEWLDEVSRLLNEIRSAWLQLPAQGRAQVAQRP
jgi:flagellar secretion chaperone FliS